MANMIQIKRSLTTANPTGLANGEFAYTSNGEVLFLGANGGIDAIAGKRYPGTLTANQALVANATSGIDKIIVANAVVTSIYANGSLGSAGQALYSNGTVAYWRDTLPATAGSDTYVQFNDGGVANAISSFTFTKSTGTVTATKFSGNGASVTSVDAATVGGNTAATLRSYSDTVAGTAYSNATSYADTKAGTAYTNAVAYAASNTYVNNTFAPKASPTFTGTLAAADVTVSGNLAVSGTLTTVGTENLIVKDSLIKLAYNNTSTDVLDIGLFGSYGSVPSFSGLFRDATDGVYKLFTGLSEEPTTTVNIAGTGYAQATLNAYLNSGAFIANSTAVSVTANSSVAVSITSNTISSGAITSSAFVSNSSVTNITGTGSISVAIAANTLSLTTALPSTSGGTGYNTFTSGDLLVANTGNSLSKLSLGTSGYVLQSNGSALIYSTIDGGTF